MRDSQSRDCQVDLHTLGLLTNKTIAAFLEPYDVVQWPEVILLATLQGVLCFEKTFGYEKVAVADLRSAVEHRDCLLRARSPRGHQGNASKKSPIQEASPRTKVQGIYPEWWGDNITSRSGATSPLRKPVQDSLLPSSSEVEPDHLQRIAAAPSVRSTRKQIEREAKSRVREHLQQAQRLARQNAAQRTERVQKAVRRHRASSLTDKSYSNIDLKWPGSGSNDSILRNPWVAALVQQNGHESD